MKRKTKHKGSVPTEYAEVKVNHGIFEDYLCHLGRQMGVGIRIEHSIPQVEYKQT